MKKIVPVILAGGIGERFWPLSRSASPKQLLALTSSSTMIEETFRRTAAIQSKGVRPLLMTGNRIASRVRALLSKKWRYDLIVEPVGKNTAPAIALAAARIQARYGESLMVVMPADHAIGPVDAFVRAVHYACFIADSRERLVVFGVRPSRPETGYGYLQLGKETGRMSGARSFMINRFIEKPDANTAKKYCSSPSYLWNSGMFVWKTSVLLEEVRSYMPGLYAQVAKAAIRKFSPAAIAAFYRSAEKESIDYGIMEKSRRVSAVAGSFSWDDIGSWEALTRIYAPNRRATTIVGDRIFEQECERSIVVNKSAHTVAAIGCRDIAVVATPDALLVIDRSRLPDIKKYLGEMKKDPRFPSNLF